MKRWGLAIMLAGLGSLVGAEAASLPPGPAENLWVQGKLAIRRGDYPAATELMARAVVLAPGESEYQHWLGNSLAWLAAGAPLREKPALGRRCLAAYRRALELDPDNLSARLSLLNFYRHVPRLLGGGLDRARDQAVEIRRRDPELGAYAQAVLYGHEKNYAEAFATLAEILRRNPAHYASQGLLGRLALESGDRLDEGAAALRRCLELPPADTDDDHETVARLLAQLNTRRSALDAVAQLR